MGYLQSHPLPYSAISIVTQIPQTPFLISSKTHISRQFQRLRCRGSTWFSCCELQMGGEMRSSKGTSGLREATGESVSGTEREARGGEKREGDVLGLGKRLLGCREQR
uniref:Uncharacterized protein n=1 Tax=Salix viminalis TaxID=40686 RepID=A0A6N2MXQ6_SALVM